MRSPSSIATRFAIALPLPPGPTSGISCTFSQYARPAVGEDHDVGVRRRDEEVTDEILLAGAHADAPLAAASLGSIGRNGGALDVARVRHGDRHVLVGDQILDPQFAAFFDDHGSPRIGVFLANLLELVEHHLHQQLVARQNRAQPLDRLEQLHQLVDDLLPLETRSGAAAACRESPAPGSVRA